MAEQEPDDLSEDIEKLEERKNHYDQWLEGLRDAQEAAPFVQYGRDITDWQIRVLRYRPEEASEIPYFSDPDLLEQENNQIRQFLPHIHVRDWSLLFSSTAATISGSSDAYEYVRRVGDLGTPDAMRYSINFGEEYRRIQEEQQRPKQVRVLLEKLNNPQTLERFDRALAAYQAHKSNTGERTAAAIEMRTLLDGIKGDLWAKAKKSPKENMTWENMAERLTIGGGSGPIHVRLIRQKKTRSSLIHRLSEVAKDREKGTLTNLEDIWTELLDHIFTVLGTIDL